MSKIKLITLFTLLVLLGLFLYASLCCIGQNKSVKMVIVQKVSLDTYSIMAIRYGENYVVETRLTAQWKVCISGFNRLKYKSIHTLHDWVQCEYIEKTKRDQMKEMIKYRDSVKRCLEINPDIILTK